VYGSGKSGWNKYLQVQPNQTCQACAQQDVMGSISEMCLLCHIWWDEMGIISIKKIRCRLFVKIKSPLHLANGHKDASASFLKSHYIRSHLQKLAARWKNKILWVRTASSCHASLEGKPQIIYSICCQDAGRRISVGWTNNMVWNATRVKRFRK
jgi:hypothetical protein